MRNPFSFLIIVIIFSSLFSCKKSSDSTGLEPSIIGPINVEEVIFGRWKDINHIQGICFSDSSIFISCSKQLIKYDLTLNQISEERLCNNIPTENCDHSHYGDIAIHNKDLWTAYHYGGWLENYDCERNQLHRFRNGDIKEENDFDIYNIDYTGHIGAIEIINNLVYVSGKYISPDWTIDEPCQPLVIYIYDLNNLKDTSITSCNIHIGEIHMDFKGSDGIQVLAKRDNENLLVAPYKCQEDSVSLIYNINLVNNTNNITVFEKKNWAYGIAVNSDQQIFYAEDNREQSIFSIFEFIQ